MATLNQWLEKIEQGQAGGVIEMGLERVNAVKNRMNLTPQMPIITVAGTNGKGSVCAFLTAIYREAGFRVGTLTSPHLLRFNERIAINGVPVDDDVIVASFERIETARAEIHLSYFEYNALAAVDIFMTQNVDVMILEVGLGGRLDAVNVFDADVAVVVSVDIDHQNFLGDTIEQIAFEKAGIFRPNRYAIFGQNPVPESLRQHAENIHAHLLLYGKDFSYKTLEQQQWSYFFNPTQKSRHALPMPVLRGAYQIQNASCALTAVECLHEKLPVDLAAIKKGLLLAENTARFQALAGRPMRILDVGHNPHAAHALKNSLQRLPFAKKRRAVFSMLNDKDLASVVTILKDQFDEWLIAPLDLPRGRSLDNIQAAFDTLGIAKEKIRSFPNIQAAWQYAVQESNEDDRIVVFGSFHTVAEVLRQI
ncbi:MAG: bifunctional tetrahydrofolate synthase/dihydrofolate synthase [Neisseriaceae bacterium]|nr:bifunctional tetrahydrofolate synthase/dihydrofolate synthase [Neisseriaceae bacterium]